MNSKLALFLLVMMNGVVVENIGACQTLNVQLKKEIFDSPDNMLKSAQFRCNDESNRDECKHLLYRNNIGSPSTPSIELYQKGLLASFNDIKYFHEHAVEPIKNCKTIVYLLYRNKYLSKEVHQEQLYHLIYETQATPLVVIVNKKSICCKEDELDPIWSKIIACRDKKEDFNAAVVEFLNCLEVEELKEENYIFSTWGTFRDTPEGRAAYERGKICFIAQLLAVPALAIVALIFYKYCCNSVTSLQDKNGNTVWLELI